MQALVLPDSFFTDLGDHRYQPTEATIGPWAPTLQHGGPPAALLTHALRTHPSANDMRLARLTIEILGPVPLDPCELSVRVLRPGKRIELLQGELRSAGKLVLLAHAWRFERVPGVSTPVADPHDAPSLPAPQSQTFFKGIDYFPYAQALEWRFVHGSYADMGPATVWARPRIPLVNNRPVDAIESMVLMLDSANGVSAELDLRQWSFVPVDLTLNLHRQPEGEWLGMAAQTIIADDGAGLVTTSAFDRAGPVGRSLHTLFVRPQG